MKKILFLIITLLLGARIASAQVLIGGSYQVDGVEIDTVPVNFTLLELFSFQEKYKGLKIPALDQTGIDKAAKLITDPTDSLSYKFYANGLILFNLSNQCMQVWQDTAFWNLCGGPKPAKGEIRNCDAVRVYGMYIAGNPLTTAHYISIPIWVEEKGTYSITVEAKRNGLSNGYFYMTSGTFTDEGREFVINIPATGTPITAQMDSLYITFNNELSSCTRMVEVKPPTPDYTIVDVQPVPQPFPIEVDLGDPLTYYAVVKLRVNVPGEWQLTTSQVNGYSFAGHGDIESASGYNPAGSFPQTIEVSIPVTGTALQYGTGLDHFTLGTMNSLNPSNYPFTVELANVAFTIDCANVTFSSHFDDLKTHIAIPSAAEITLPVNVTYAGSTIVKANFEHIEFSSVAPGTSNPAGSPAGTTKLNLGAQTIKLRQSTTPSTPTDDGVWPVIYSSSLGGLMQWYCDKDSVEIKVSHAQMSALEFVSYNGTGEAYGTGGSDKLHPYSSKTTGGVYTVDPYVSPDSLVQHPRDNPVQSITVKGTVTIPGDYDYSITLNGITYSATGTFTATGAQNITLTPSGTLTDWSQKVVQDTIFWYKTTDTPDNPTGQLVVPMSFMFRAMRILSLGSRNSGYDRPFGKNISTSNSTSSAHMEVWNETNFGPMEHSIKFVGDFIVDNGITGTSQTRTDDEMLSSASDATALAKYINDSVPDIMFYMAGTATLDDAIIDVLVDFVKNKKGMLNISTYNYSVSARLFNLLYNLSGTSAYSGSSTIGINNGSATADFITYPTLSHNNRIAPDAENDILFMGGPFKPDSATWYNTSYKKFVADDCGDGNSILISKLPSTVKVLAYRSGNAGSTANSNNYTTHAYMLRDTIMGFFWCGDYAWANGAYANRAVRDAWPNRADQYGNLLPASAQPFGAASLTSSSASALYNNVAFCNSFAWAIDYAAYNRVPGTSPAPPAPTPPAGEEENINP
ncbi:MAG: hypothetical protein LBR64_02765 [Dysgonamonadaceae bacterium]|jgi:hypothetical protein|nr:hypothetical protein [Dysgonamonadaceae bacterium]